MLKELAKLIWTTSAEHFTIERIAELSKVIFNVDSIKKFFALLLTILEMCVSLVFDTGVTPYGEPLDLTGYELVFCDEFEGDSLNTDVWNYRVLGERRAGYNAKSQITVNNGELIMTGEYLENGEYGEGWYGGMINLKETYTRGYFEIKCICAENDAFWSAFWMQSPNSYEPALSQGGIGGAEIDIFEAIDNGLLKRNTVIQTVYCSGIDGDMNSGIQGLTVARAKADNIHEKYNTYGLKWTEDEYIFYVNGVETERTSFGNGVSTTPEEVIVSLELSDDFSKLSKDYKAQMKVDYVKIYQVK